VVGGSKEIRKKRLILQGKIKGILKGKSKVVKVIKAVFLTDLETGPRVNKRGRKT